MAKKKTTKKKIVKKIPQDSPLGAVGEQAGFVAVPLSFHMEGAAQLCNHLVVQHDAEMFYLSFFQAAPPFLPEGAAETIVDAVEQIGQIDADLVAKVAISRGRMKAFIDALTKNYERSIPGQQTSDSPKDQTNGNPKTKK